MVLVQVGEGLVHLELRVSVCVCVCVVCVCRCVCRAYRGVAANKRMNRLVTHGPAGAIHNDRGAADDFNRVRVGRVTGLAEGLGTVQHRVGHGRIGELLLCFRVAPNVLAVVPNAEIEVYCVAFCAVPLHTRAIRHRLDIVSVHTQSAAVACEENLPVCACVCCVCVCVRVCLLSDNIITAAVHELSGALKCGVPRRVCVRARVCACVCVLCV